MLKKAVYGMAALGLMFSALGASAGEQYWTGERYQGVSALPFVTFPSGAEAPRSAATPKVQLAKRVQDQAESSDSPFPPNQPE